MRGRTPEAKLVLGAVIAVIGFAVFPSPNSLAGQSTDGPMPVVSREGPALEFDFPELHIGVAEYDEGPTGTTVFYFPDGIMTVVDVRGGGPGTINTDALRLGYEDKVVRAVTFSGGSSFGLSAATGVANEIKDVWETQGVFDQFAAVGGAIIFDIGGRRFSGVMPDDRLGRAALRSAAPGWFPLGARGAGRFAQQGGYFNRREATATWPDRSALVPYSGQGGAFRTIGETKVGVFTVVNSLGAIVDRNGGVVRCERNSTGQPCPSISEMFAAIDPEQAVGAAETPAGGLSENTTLTLVVTNQIMPWAELQRLAVQVHTSMGRAIQPFSTSADGDVLFAATTGQVEGSLNANQLMMVASDLAWDAVLSSVPELSIAPEPQPVSLSAEQWNEYAGAFEFYGRRVLNVERAAGGLSARLVSGGGGPYFALDRAYTLIPAGTDLFIIDAPAQDVIRFDRSGQDIVGITLNPGPWASTARLRRP